MSLRCLFVVQGEGRGHLTQALSLRRMLDEAGHRIEGVVVGRSRCREVPSFFQEAFEGPVTFVESPSFVPDDHDRSVRPWTTVMHELRRAPVFWESLGVIDEAIERHDPDVVVNFFEPLMGLYAMWHRPSVPIVAVAHQYMFLHPEYRFPPGWHVQRGAARVFARLTAWGATQRLALSLYPAPDQADRGLFVLPPLLRAELFERDIGQSEPFFLVYLLNSGYADEVVRWHAQNPGVQLHCFWDRPSAAPVETYDETLTFHQLDDQKFLDFMARARGFVSTAGFESVAEAMYLGTPVQVVPVEGHFEQLCNAFDTVRAGAGIRSARFNIDRLRNFLPHYSDEGDRFRTWMHGSRSRFIQAIERAVDVQDASVSALRPEPKALETA